MTEWDIGNEPKQHTKVEKAMGDWLMFFVMTERNVNETLSEPSTERMRHWKRTKHSLNRQKLFQARSKIHQGLLRAEVKNQLIISKAKNLS